MKLIIVATLAVICSVVTTLVFSLTAIPAFIVGNVYGMIGVLLWAWWTE